MTSNTDGAAQGEWQKAPEQRYPAKGGRGTEPTGLWRVKDSSHTIAQNCTEADADRIIADHRYVTRLLAALIQQRQALEQSKPFMTWAPETLREQVAAALALDHAALVAEGVALGVSAETQNGPGARRQDDDAAGAGG